MISTYLKKSRIKVKDVSFVVKGEDLITRHIIVVDILIISPSNEKLIPLQDEVNSLKEQVQLFVLENDIKLGRLTIAMIITIVVALYLRFKLQLLLILMLIRMVSLIVLIGN